MTGRFNAAFAGKRRWLVDNIDIGHGLLEDLRDKQILTAYHVADCQVKYLTPQECVERLLKILVQRGDDDFQPFLRALTENEQEKVVRYLTGDEQGGGSRLETKIVEQDKQGTCQLNENRSAEQDKKDDEMDIK